MQRNIWLWRNSRHQSYSRYVDRFSASSCTRVTNLVKNGPVFMAHPVEYAYYVLCYTTATGSSRQTSIPLTLTAHSVMWLRCLLIRVARMFAAGCTVHCTRRCDVILSFDVLKWWGHGQGVKPLPGKFLGVLSSRNGILSSAVLMHNARDSRMLSSQICYVCILLLRATSCIVHQHGTIPYPHCFLTNRTLAKMEAWCCCKC